MTRTFALIGALTLLVAAPARAADFSFMSNDGSFNDFVFSIPTSPAPNGSNATSFTINNVSTTEDGQFGPLVYNANYTFYTDAAFGGFQNGFVAYYSVQLFGGTTTSPIFYNGTFDLSDYNGGPTVATLTITNAATAPANAVPEPASWVMMVVGFGLIGGALRRRKIAVSFA